MYNVELVDVNNVQFLFDVDESKLPHEEKLKQIESYKKQLRAFDAEAKIEFENANTTAKAEEVDKKKYDKKLQLIWNNILASLLCSFKEDFKLTYEYKQGMVAQPEF